MMKLSVDPNTLAALAAAAAASCFEGPMGRGGPASGRLPDFPPDFLEGPAVCCLTPFDDIALEVVVGLISLQTRRNWRFFGEKLQQVQTRRASGKDKIQNKPSQAILHVGLALPERRGLYVTR